MHFVLVLTTAAGERFCRFVVSSCMPSGSCDEPCRCFARFAQLFARALMQSKSHLRSSLARAAHTSGELLV